MSKSNASLRLTHCRHDAVICLAPGLFRMLHKGTRSDVPLNVTYEFQEGWSIEFSAGELLGPDDLLVLQGLVGLAGPTGQVISTTPTSPEGLQLRNLLELDGVARHDDLLRVTSSFRTLAREIGLSEGGRVLKHIRTSIERLWKVSVIVQDPRGQRVGFRLLSSMATDTKRLDVALNPRISAAVLGNIRHTRMSMIEIRRLRSDAARLLHQRLSAWIDADGLPRRAELDTLCGYIWPGHQESSAETMRKRRWSCRQAIAEIARTGWSFTKYAAQKYEILRPCK